MTTTKHPIETFEHPHDLHENFVTRRSVSRGAIAAVLMSLSTIIVAFNAQLLRRTKL